MPHVHINFLAVIVAAVVAFLIGGLWYSPLLFAKLWVKAHGYTDEQVAAMQKGAAKAYGVTLVCQFLIALAMAVLIGYLDLHRCVQGLKLGFLVWAGFAVPLGLTAHMFSQKRISVLCIDAGYQLVYLLLMGAILTVWR